MKPRVPIFVVLLIVCLTALAGVFVQHRQLKSLRADQQRLSAVRAPTNERRSLTPTGVQNVSASRLDPSPALLELLRLRSQAGRLAEQKRQLANARGENEQLQAQLAARSTNSPGTTLPPGYIRSSEARWVGQNTSMNAMQSFVWAVKNRDAASLMRLLSPEFKETLLKQGDSPEKLFEANMFGMPGMRVVLQQTLPDGTLDLQIEFVPEKPGVSTVAHRVLLRQIAGEWKLDVK